MSTAEGAPKSTADMVDPEGRGAPAKTFMDFSLTYDPYTHKATEYKISNCSRPHMRAFHLAWTSFLMGTAFLSIVVRFLCIQMC
eukprot:1324567-Amorphochlora_amoeboformis.AAC.2